MPSKFFSHEERLAITRRQMAFKEMIKHADEVPPAPGALENPEPIFDENHCPYCGSELRHESGCVRCSKCPWSKCG